MSFKKYILTIRHIAGNIMISIGTENIHQTKYQDSIAISNLACNLEHERDLVCKFRVFEDSGV
jgi:hypothetical protein